MKKGIRKKKVVRKKQTMVRINRTLLRDIGNISSRMDSIERHMCRLVEIRDSTDWREKYHDLRALVEHDRLILMKEPVS
jgi:hypothetical protein